MEGGGVVISVIVATVVVVAGGAMEFIIGNGMWSLQSDLESVTQRNACNGGRMGGRR